MKEPFSKFVETELGAGFLLNRKAFQKIMEDFCKNAALLFFGGLLALVVGFSIILTHNLWVADWRMLITFIGWAGAVKGVWMTVFPDSVPKFMMVYRKNTSLLTVHGVAALAFGVVLTLLGFFVG